MVNILYLQIMVIVESTEEVKLLNIIEVQKPTVF